ncbi:MAG: hypothetical protein HON90_12135, partial [Halobacteriovoraceae bacterium]|nr:hypothetical protein [Halobacteriovoraceae bacterium]
MFLVLLRGYLFYLLMVIFNFTILSSCTDGGSTKVSKDFDPASTVFLPVASDVVISDGPYILNDEITITVEFDRVMYATDNPRLPIILDSGNVLADYDSGSGTSKFIFKYSIALGDLDVDGASIVGLPNFDQGSYTDIEENTIKRPFSGFDFSNVTLDGVIPEVTSVALPTNKYYMVADDLDFVLSYNDNVTVVGTPRLEIALTTGTVYADYLSGDGTDILTFRYTVQGGDADLVDGLGLMTLVDLNSGTLKDISGNISNLSFAAQTTSGILIDGIIALVTGVTAPANATYKLGDNLDFTVDFDENVYITGSPRAQITLGSGTVYANYLSGTGTSSIIFRYTVANGNLDTDGLTMVSPLELNGGVLEDIATNAASLNYTLPNTSLINIDGIPPTITSVTPPANANYKLGDNLDFVVNYDDNIDVTGIPRIPLTLTSGTVYATYLSGTGSANITYRYTVGATDIDIDGITLVTPMQLNGGTIRDNNLNDAVLTYTLPNTSLVNVDGVVPTITSVTPPANTTYKIGNNVDFTVNFDQTVDVVGTPRI